MTSFLSSLFGRGSKGTPSKTKVAMITNFSACPLGLHLLDNLQNCNSHVVAISHDASKFEERFDSEKVSLFEAFPNEEEDRNRIISFLKAKNMQLTTLV